MGPGTRTLADDNVEFEILHCGIKDLFDVGLQAMNLVDKQHVSEFQIRQYRREITFQLNQWTRSCPKMRAHFVGDYRCQRGLAEARRTIKQNVVERLAAFSGGLNGNVEIVFNALLSDVLGQDSRTKRQLECCFFLDHRPRYHSLRHIMLWSRSAASA